MMDRARRCLHWFNDLYVVWLVGLSLVAFLRPSTMLWFDKPWIFWSLAASMLGMGLPFFAGFLFLFFVGQEFPEKSASGRRTFWPARSADQGASGRRRYSQMPAERGPASRRVGPFFISSAPVFSSGESGASKWVTR